MSCQQFQIPLRKTLTGGRHDSARQGRGVPRVSEVNTDGLQVPSNMNTSGLQLPAFNFQSSIPARLLSFQSSLQFQLVFSIPIQLHRHSHAMGVAEPVRSDGVQPGVGSWHVQPWNFRIHLVSPPVDCLHQKLVDFHVQSVRSSSSSH